jgi:single stranded DNA-binding protein
MNVVHLLGRVITDPTLEEATNSGKKICRFRMATSNGKTHPPSRHYIVILGRDQSDAHPGNVYNILVRGSKVQVTGRISESRWQNKTTGQFHSRTEIIATSVEFVTVPSRAVEENSTEEAVSAVN